MTDGFNARVLSSLAELDAYADAPGSAFARTPDLRLPHDPAFLGALAARGYSGDPRFLVLERDGEPWAVVPLLSHAHATGTLGAVVRGTPPHDAVDLSDWLLLPPARTRAGFAAVLRAAFAAAEADVLHVTRVAARSHLATVVREAAPHTTRRESGANVWCDVSSRQALAGLSKQQLRNINRKHRRAEKDFGAVEFLALPHEGKSAEAFDRFVAVEDSGWKGAHGTGTSLRHDAPLREFLRLALSRFAARGRARVDVLTIDGRDAAAQLAFRTGDTWYILKIGYQPEFRDVGPGAILLKSFLERMSEDPGIREVNIMTAPQWAVRWHFRSEPCHEVVFHATTWRGRALSIAASARQAARGLRDRMAKSSEEPAS